MMEGNRQTSAESASLPQDLGCNTLFDMRLRVIFLRRRPYNFNQTLRTWISSKMATIDEFALKKYWSLMKVRNHPTLRRIFESEIILIPPSLKISESSSNGSYRNTDEVWWRYGISRSCDECHLYLFHCIVS